MSGVKPRQCFTYVFSGGHTNPFPFSVCGCGGGSAGALDAVLASIVNLVIVVYTGRLSLANASLSVVIWLRKNRRMNDAVVLKGCGAKLAQI